MEFSDEITVEAGVDRVWAALLDLPRVAGCLAGARLDPKETDGAYPGTMRLKIGTIKGRYEGTVRLVEADEVDRVTKLAVEGREAEGEGTATATIRVSLTDQGPKTRIGVDVDLAVGARLAQVGGDVGGDVVQDTAQRMLNDFAGRLEREILHSEDRLAGGSPEDQAAASSRDAEAGTSPDADEVTAGPLARRLAPYLAGTVLLATILLVLDRCRRGGGR
jgi:uncharacterized protein